MLSRDVGQGVLAYLDLLTRLLKHVKPSAIADIYKAVFRLFLVIFDYRRDVRGAVNEQVRRVFDLSRLFF